MNRSIILTWILALPFLQMINLNAASVDSLTYYQMQYSQGLNNLQNLTTSYGKLDADFADLNAQILQLSSVANPGWNTKRKISRLTARKAEINTAMTEIEVRLATQKKAFDFTFNKYYAFISKRIKSALKNYDQTSDLRQRQNITRNLVELVELRGQLLSSRPQYPNTAIIPHQPEDLVALIKKFNNQAAISTDVSRILDERIHQIALMISAANAEKDLRQRLNQLNLEMNAFSGEPVSRDVALQTDDLDNITEPTWSYGSEKGTRSITDNAALPATSQLLTTADYLPLFQKMPTNDLPLYISRLDSLRRYYQKQLQEIRGIK